MHLIREILPNGNLKISTNDRHGLWDILDSTTRDSSYGIVSEYVMTTVFEEFIANSAYDWVKPEQIGALTDAPILGEDAFDENGIIITTARFWYYDAYMLKSPIEDLFVEGFVIFTAAGEAHAQ